MSETGYRPLVFYQREGLTEITIFGAVCIFSEGKIIHQVGGDPLLYGRSLTKPYQMKPIAHDLKDLSLRARALTVASHNAEAMHLTALDEIVASANAGEIFGALQVPESLPLMPLGRTSLTKAKTHHPCSGKHAAILRASRIHGWSTDDYLSQAHPYHEAYLQSLRLVLGSRWLPQRTAIDGCGLPAPTFRLSELAHLYEALAARRGDDWIWEAMTSHPEIIGGSERLDTDLMLANRGRLAAKEGADGLLGLAFEHAGRAVGVAIKIAHGHDPRAAGVVAAEILQRYHLRSIEIEAPHGQSVHVAGPL